MTEEEKQRPGDQPYSLEELNQQFSSSISKQKKPKKISAILLLVLLAAVVLIIALIAWRIMAGNQSSGERTGEVTAVTTGENNIKEIETEAQKETLIETQMETFSESILNEEEREKWTSNDLNAENVYVELNSKIYLDGSKAYIRLINPIYSSFSFRITLHPEGEEDTILYQSEKLAPGTILEAVMLAAEPAQEQYHAVVKYLVYDGGGNELGTYSVNVEFTTDEQYK